jgi:hypothetical protein
MKARLITRPRIFGVSPKLIATTIVVLLATLGVTAEHASAYAANEIGRYEAPNVTCDAWMNTISVQGVFGAGTAYNTTRGQSLAVRYWAVNVNRNESFWLSPNGSWSGFTGLYWTGYMYTPLAWNVPSEYREVTAPNIGSDYGTAPFDVYAQYAWLTSTGWVFRTVKRSYYGVCYL